MDIYASNMFSSAGNRITFQRQFKADVPEAVRSQFQHIALGNTLFEASSGKSFKDVSIQAGVTLGRWAWCSKFVDFNNDGWDDILVANGFITTEDTGDL
jgi:FG-GAP-like repeat